VVSTMQRRTRPRMIEVGDDQIVWRLRVHNLVVDGRRTGVRLEPSVGRLEKYYASARDDRP
jgi:predicted DNA-binding ribbon-helix-helix protein